MAISCHDFPGPHLDGLPEGLQALVGARHHLVVVAGHQPLHRMPHKHDLVEVVLGELKLLFSLEKDKNFGSLSVPFGLKIPNTSNISTVSNTLSGP